MGCGWRVPAGGVCFVRVLAELGKFLAALGQKNRQLLATIRPGALRAQLVPSLRMTYG